MTIRTLRPADVPTIAQLEQDVWAEEGATEDQIRSRATTFAEGSTVVETADGRIVGYTVVQLVKHISTGSWDEQTDRGMIASTHCTDGALIYGVNMTAQADSAHPDISGDIISYYHRTFVENGPAHAICLGSRLPGFARWSATHGTDISEYLKPNDRGRSNDPELRLYERNGFNVLWPISNYFPDKESLDFGAMIIRK